MISVTANISGIQELEMVMLQALKPEVQSAILTEALKAGGKIIESQARENAPDRTGALQASIHAIVKKAKPGHASVTVSTGDYLDGGRWYATFEEFGWHPGGGKFASATPESKRWLEVAMEQRARRKALGNGAEHALTIAAMKRNEARFRGYAAHAKQKAAEAKDELEWHPGHLYMERALTMTVSAVEAVCESIIMRRVQEALK